VFLIAKILSRGYGPNDESSRRARRLLDAPDRARDVLVEIARDPGGRIRDLAAADITGRTAQVIVADLEAAGYITRTRTGRRTRYTVNRDSLFRHPAQEGYKIGPFLTLLATPRDTSTPPSPDDESGRRKRTKDRSDARSRSCGPAQGRNPVPVNFIAPWPLLIFRAINVISRGGHRYATVIHVHSAHQISGATEMDAPIRKQGFRSWGA
jgi:hypothetical protein